MLNRLPTPVQCPQLPTLLADIGNPSARQLGRALGVTERTARRWIAQGQAPRPVLLALFWITHHGRHSVHIEAENAAMLQAALARCRADELALLRAELARVLALADTGAANDASRLVKPLAAVLPFRPRVRPAPG